MKLNKDNWTLGVIIGLIVPLVIYALAIATLSRYGYVDNLIYTPRPKMPALIAVCGNLLAFRFYMVNKKFDRTGRGILLVTFLMVMLIFSLL
ncbi:MAG: hypothetical protein RG741_05840 [Bacteroidales bacterium]|nr:hypothetical protein [Bacteroidales bacterium]